MIGQHSGRMAIMEPLTKHQKKDIRLLGKFVEVYCAGKHGAVERAPLELPAALGTHSLCPECAAFLGYAVVKRLKCPLEAEKPTCKHCRIHCYDTVNREKVREVMSFAGRRLMMRGRLDYLWHYLF
jgi:hypothetical protein